MNDHASSIEDAEGYGIRLPARRAFVLQFSESSGAERRAFSGRIEHVQSGRARGFEGGEELLAALEAALADLIDGPGAQGAPRGAHHSDL